MRSQQEDNHKLCQLVALYMKGETAMETPARRARLWVVRQLVGIESQCGVWKWARDWRGRCLQAGLDPETFEITDAELFNSWWSSYAAEYSELKRKQRERVARRKSQEVWELNGVMPDLPNSSSKVLEQGVATFKLPKFK